MVLLQVAVVTVGFPATPLLLGRARICCSASHSKEDLIKALEVIEKMFFPSLDLSFVISVFIFYIHSHFLHTPFFFFF